MAFVLTGVVQGMRPVDGVIEDGRRKGEKWQFLSLEIADSLYGRVYSCQMRDNDPQYKEYVAEDGKKLRQDLTDHRIKVSVKNITAGEREIEDKESGQKRVILQVRMQITKVRDLGVADDEE